jgi:hypothetical protein
MLVGNVSQWQPSTAHVPLLKHKKTSREPGGFHLQITKII